MNAPATWKPFVDRLVPDGSAAQLASLRIVVPAMILITPELRHARELAAAPAELRVAPEGLGWFVAWVPITRDGVVVSCHAPLPAEPTACARAR